MSMREFIVIAGGLKISEEIFESAPVENKRDNSVWIAPNGQRVLREDATDNHIQIMTENDEFQAYWSGDLTQNAAKRLADIINEAPDFEVYYLNSMTFMMKRQALAAANSLAKHP
jgi:hypothetical protein